jgi:hypothetical protein
MGIVDKIFTRVGASDNIDGRIHFYGRNEWNSFYFE